MILEIRDKGPPSVSIMDRTQNFSSICSRIANVTAVTQTPEFAELIRELTVDVRTTQKAIRKLISVDNKKPYAKQLGGSAGTILVGICVGLIVVLDIPWHACCNSQ